MLKICDICVFKNKIRGKEERTLLIIWGMCLFDKENTENIGIEIKGETCTVATNIYQIYIFQKAPKFKQHKTIKPCETCKLC